MDRSNGLLWQHLSTCTVVPTIMYYHILFQIIYFSYRDNTKHYKSLKDTLIITQMIYYNIITLKI